jgi:hypothetical protein
MSTLQTRHRYSQHHRPRVAVGLLALGALIAIGVTILVLGLIGADRMTIPTSTTGVTHPQTASAAIAAQAGAKLDHSGPDATVTQTTDGLANYPDAPPPSASTPQPSVSYYLDAPRP